VAVLVIVLVVTNLVTLTALYLQRRRSVADAADGSEVFEAPRPPGATGRNRRLITIEVLNPIELATTRGGRVAGLASTLAPGLTRRIVYDQTLKTLRRELDDKGVHADVRLHSLRPAGTTAPEGGRTTVDPSVLEVTVVDEVAPLDLSKAAPRDGAKPARDLATPPASRSARRDQAGLAFPRCRPDTDG
jgi:hypothetical protein